MHNRQAENLRAALGAEPGRPSRHPLHLATEGLTREAPLSQRGGSGRNDLETAPLVRAVCREGMETRGPASTPTLRPPRKLEAGILESRFGVDAKMDPRPGLRACAMLRGPWAQEGT